MTAIATQAHIELPKDRPVIWAPAAGFQTLALASGCDETLIGGAKGSGKSDVLVVRPTRQVDKPRFKALITRQSFPEMQELIARSHRLYPLVSPKAHWRGDDRAWTFPSGAVITFGFLSKVEECQRYQGGEWAEWNHDEAGNLADENVVTTMQAEIRCPDPTVHRSIMFSANPGGPGHRWLKKRYVTPTNGGQQIAWSVEVVNGQPVYRSRAFIPGRVWDNPVYANDPKYIATLMALPDRKRKYLLGGSWDDPEGAAFDMLDRARHFVRPFTVPSHWVMSASYDWGIAHPAVSVVAAVDEDGCVWVVDTIWLVGMSDEAQALRLRERLPLGRLQGAIPAGHDVFAVKRQDNTPTTADRFAQHQIILTHANLDRKHGYLTLASALEWRADDEVGIAERDPAVRFMDTPGNRRLFAQLEALVMDPDDPEKVFKPEGYRVDQLPADPDEAITGDDGYDALRYLLASRPAIARGQLDLRRDQIPYAPLQKARVLPAVTALPDEEAWASDDGAWS